MVYEHYHGAIIAEIKSGDYAAAQEAKAQEFQKGQNGSASVTSQLRRAWWIVRFWGFPMALFGIPMAGARAGDDMKEAHMNRDTIQEQLQIHKYREKYVDQAIEVVAKPIQDSAVERPGRPTG